MQISASKVVATICIAFALVLVSCQKELDVIYGVNKTQALRNSPKDKLKSNEQYVAVLHANLFQEGISVRNMTMIQQLVSSLGDKKLAYELIISSFMNDASITLPTTSEMNADKNAFIEATYERFYVRKPSELEKAWWINYLDSNPTITPELVYLAFALSDEYFHY